MESQGIELAEEEEMPDDPYTIAQTQRKDGPHPRNVTGPSDNNLKRFLQYDGKVLRFEAVWDDRETECGEMRKYQIFYYLYDDTMAVKECHYKNGGRDQFPMLLKKIRIPKNWRERTVDTPHISHEPVITKDNESEFYNPYDLTVGSTVTILGRKFLLYDCDYFTRNYYKTVLNIEQGEPVCLPDTEEKPLPRQIPPHIGIGDPEDTLLSCFTFHSKSPKKDIIQYNLNANKFLRYLCEMVSVYPEDQGRKFILAYYLADSTIRVDEIPIRNSGLVAGRFSGPGRVRVPHSNDFYTPEMFYIGALVIINRHRFKITGVDLFVYRYMLENPEKFTPFVIDNIRTHLLLQGKLTENTQGTLPHPDERHISQDNAEQCHQEMNIDREVNDAGVDNPYNDDGLGHNKHTAHLRRRMDSCSLPPPLRGLDGFKDMSFLDSTDKIPERKEQPIVCLSGPSVSYQGYLKEPESLAKAVDETDQSGAMDSLTCTNQARSSPNQVIAAGKPTKMVTFAELPMFSRRKPAPED